MMGYRLHLMACTLALGLATPSFAQTNPPSSQSVTDPSGSGCKQSASKASPATNPAPASNDGTAPGNAGNTGWSGGTGGSFIGTNPSGASEASKTWQPATARGLDPIASKPRPIPANC